MRARIHREVYPYGGRLFRVLKKDDKTVTVYMDERLHGKPPQQLVEYSLDQVDLLDEHPRTKKPIRYVKEDRGNCYLCNMPIKKGDLIREVVDTRVYPEVTKTCHASCWY